MLATWAGKKPTDVTLLVPLAKRNGSNINGYFSILDVNVFIPLASNKK